MDALQACLQNQGEVYLAEGDTDKSMHLFREVFFAQFQTTSEYSFWKQRAVGTGQVQCQAGIEQLSPATVRSGAL
jgi:hypothetical protein